jgi:hypothetical protein
MSISAGDSNYYLALIAAKVGTTENRITANIRLLTTRLQVRVLPVELSFLSRN